MSAILGAILALHIAGGILAIPAGAVAIAARKGGSVHRLAGTWFLGSMLVLGATAAILEPFRTPEPGSPIVGVFVCYFVLTSWVAARRHDGRAGWFEALAATAAIGTGAPMLMSAWTGTATPTPAGMGPVFIVGGLCLYAGILDLSVVLRKQLTPGQRITRHLWRMCLAFFIATGSFFIGQQDVLPQAVRGSPALFVLGFSPLAILLFWLVRMRFAKPLRRITESLRARPAPQQG